VQGNAALRAGMVVKIEGAGNTFSGRYYVSTVTHLSPDAGYRTSFSVRGMRRNGHLRVAMPSEHASRIFGIVMVWSPITKTPTV
jgi:hypothetical protein